MTQFQKITVFLLRLSLGWMLFYSGITKVLNPKWSAAGYLGNAKQLAPLYDWLASSSLLPITNFVNEWALTLLGACLIVGLGVRITAVLSALIMLLYYIPLGLPYPNPNSYIVDQHVIYIFALLLLSTLGAGRIWGLDQWINRNKLT